MNRLLVGVTSFKTEETENGVVFRRVRGWDLGLGGFCKKCVFAVVVDVDGRFFYIWKMRRSLRDRGVAASS